MTANMLSGILPLAAVGGSGLGMVEDLLVILAGAGLVALILQRMRLAVIPAYLITGALIGPHALGFVPAPDSLEAISELAIVLLLFGVGMELNLGALRHSLGRMTIAGLGSCLAVTLLGWPVAQSLGLSPAASLTLAMAFSLSSTAVVLRLMGARRQLRQQTGRLALAILVLQDLAVLAMLAALPALARWHANGGALAVTDLPADLPRALLLGGGRLAAVVALILGARFLLPRLLRESLRGRSAEVLMIVGIAAALGAAVITRGLGFSLEMGAFLAGFVLAPTPFRHQLGGQIGPLRDLFLAVFFTVLGMSLDPNILVEAWEVVALGVGAVILIKIFAIGLFVWMVGTRGGTALAVGLALAQGGEFSLVLVGAAEGFGILDERASVTAIAVVVITLVLTPLLTALGFRLQPHIALGLPPWSRSRRAENKAEDDLSDGVVGPHVVVAGYGPTGRAVVDRLSAEDISCTVVELNPATVRREQPAGTGIRFVLGDASNFEVLESAGLGEADALVLTMPDEGAILRAAAQARAEHPDLYIAVRTGALSSVDSMMEAGVNHVTAEESAAADALAVCVTSRLGKPVDPGMNTGSE